LIREHAFNSQWWGEPVGIVSDTALFALDHQEQTEQLSAYAWVEFVGQGDTPSLEVLARAGFIHVDTQINFKLDLLHLPALPDFADVKIQAAADVPFTIGEDELAPFEHERFRHLPGVGPARLKERYKLWANRLIAAHPQWCLRVMYGDKVQGWFLSERDDAAFHLTLAALHRDATISGMLLYHSALSAYAELGQRVGRARFSASNSAVHNIYARLGARFQNPTEYWLWRRPAHGSIP
jgi:hypothetical protein